MMVFNDSTYTAYILAIVSCAVGAASFFWAWYRDKRIPRIPASITWLLVISVGLFLYASAYTRYPIAAGIDTDRSWMFMSWWWVGRTWQLSIVLTSVAIYVVGLVFLRRRRYYDWDGINRRQIENGGRRSTDHLKKVRDLEAA